jgi:hypothetical protein
MMETVSVGIREFRTDMAQYINSQSPVAITRHSQTIGYFIPKRKPTKEDFNAVKQASAKLHKLLAEDDIDVEELVAAFKAARLADRKATQVIAPAHPAHRQKQPRKLIAA